MTRCRDVFAATVWMLLFTATVAHQAAALQTASPPVPRLYFFTQSNCPPCSRQKPEIDRLVAAGYPVQEIDVRAQPAWVEKFQIDRTPSLVLVFNNQVVQRIDSAPQPVPAEEIVGWFQSLQSAPAAAHPQPVARLDVGSQTGSPATLTRSSGDLPSSDPTHGDRQPGNAVESAALQATVRIKVTEADSLSFATGTIVHSHGNEAIVLTCGHVFRENQGAGEITAEYGWLPGDRQQIARGQLLTYDAGPRDVALVRIVAETPLPAIPVAPPKMVVSQQDQVFTIGCDHGQPPTIRRTRIKNLSNYDGVDKYDIFGRPVEGRSGGGMFSSGGQLLGVCNAAAVDFDEGIYSSLPNIWTELARSGLDRILMQAPATLLASSSDAANFPTDHPTLPATARPDSNGFALSLPASRSNPELVPVERPTTPPMTLASNESSPSARLSANSEWNTGDSPNRDAMQGNGRSQPAETELIVVVRDRSTGQTRTIVIDRPESSLLDYLAQHESATGATAAEEADARMAQLRRTMPVVVDQQRGETTARAQSPEK